MRLIVHDPSGAKVTVPFRGDLLSVGRREGNDIRLTARNISREHCRFVREGETVAVEDLDSSTGIRVDGAPAYGRVVLQPGQQVQVGDYTIVLEGAAGAGVRQHADAVSLEVDDGSVDEELVWHSGGVTLGDDPWGENAGPDDVTPGPGPRRGDLPPPLHRTPGPGAAAHTPGPPPLHRTPGPGAAAHTPGPPPLHRTPGPGAAAHTPGPPPLHRTPGPGAAAHTPGPGAAPTPGPAPAAAPPPATRQRAAAWIPLLGLALVAAGAAGYASALWVGGGHAAQRAPVALPAPAEAPPSAASAPDLAGAAEKLYARGELERAGALFELAAAARPDDAELQRRLAEIRARQGDGARSSTHWRRYLELRPGDPQAERIRSAIENWERAAAR
ncbi:FHA domain-containing protein [Vulgatibacter sp.]|uniref:FHA domain-containing protein n=1 Tax=Vulgatibacter sp. TaxID=1971226 RepID=UPI00356A6F1B